MPDPILFSAWSALGLGLFALFAGLGELRKPGHWQRLIEEIVASPALQMITGLIELGLGIAIYAGNPWGFGDWLSGMMAVIGGLMCVEALIVLTFSDIYLAFWLRRFGPLSKLWAGVSIVFGLALIASGTLRFWGG